MKIRTVLAVLSIMLLTASCDDSSGTDPVYWGRSPGDSLYIAISRNDIKLVEKIINDGFNVNGVIGIRYGDQPLHVAAYYRRYEIAKLLLNKGANVNGVMPDTRARTPLLTAIWKNHYDVTLLLLENGADPMIPTSEGESACEFAKRIGNVQILPHLSGCA